MSLYLWSTRCIPAFSICAVAVLLLFAFYIHPYGHGQDGQHDGQASRAQLVLSVYTVLLHIMSIMFPARVCWSMLDMNKKMKEANVSIPNTRRRELVDSKSDEADWAFPVPLFVILLPAYKEEMETLETTLRVLASHPQARHCYHIYLAMEEKEEKCESKAAALACAFDKSFYRVSYTVHPSNIPGEAQGKSSNESWAAKQACRDYSEESMKENIIITTMDADTHFSPRYFQDLARLHTAHPTTKDTTMYVPPLVFDRNLHRVPLCVRTADMMWAGAGLSSLYEGSRVCIPTSVYSLPMTLVERIGGWDTGPGAIGEDMHMYLKCFFALGGNLTCRIVYAAASQCNVSSDLPGFAGYADGLRARYRQALRHMWGSLDSGFTFRSTLSLAAVRRAARFPASTAHNFAPPSTLYRTLHRLSLGALTYCSAPWTALTSTNPWNPHKPLLRLSAAPENAPQTPPLNVLNLLTLYHRLFEAHFLPTHLALILTTSSVYSYTHPNALIPPVLALALDFSGYCRLVGYTLMMCYFILYSHYHYSCLSIRQEELRRAGLLETMAEHDGFSEKVFQVGGVFEALLFPLGGFGFGAIPALHAVISHLFTERLTYVVSLKPQLGVRQQGGAATP